MTKTLSQIKAGARKKLSKKACYGNIELADINGLFDEIIDATFLAIKEGVVPEEKEAFSKVSSEEWGHPNGWNACRAEVLRNFDAMEGNEKSV